LILFSSECSDLRKGLAMRYPAPAEGIFISRPNRFLAKVQIAGEEVLCHVKNTGRCRELLRPGARLILQHHDNPRRRTAYSVIGVYKGDVLVNMDSQAPNQVAYEWALAGADGLFGEVVSVKREQTYGNSRFDLYLECIGETGAASRIFMEVKGVTLEEDGVARFPDAPTERGLKHVEELVSCGKEGYGACLLFVVQMKGVVRLEPNWQTHRAFGEALLRAKSAGVRILAYDCLVTTDSLTLCKSLPVLLKNEQEYGRITYPV
jgi:sugar fermentation stimulation protein A